MDMIGAHIWMALGDFFYPVRVTLEWNQWPGSLMAQVRRCLSRREEAWNSLKKWWPRPETFPSISSPPLSPELLGYSLLLSSGILCLLMFSMSDTQNPWSRNHLQLCRMDARPHSILILSSNTLHLKFPGENLIGSVWSCVWHWSNQLYLGWVGGHMTWLAGFSRRWMGHEENDRNFCWQNASSSVVPT
jgi:hypothetical protein